jgi:hypothetical protein
VCATANQRADRRSVGRPQCAVTGADGHFQIGNLPADKYRVTAAAAGYLAVVEPNEGTLELLSGQVRSGLDFALTKGGAEVSGVVLDIGGGPIAGALVTQVPSWGQSSCEGAVSRSNDDGTFAITVKAGHASLTIHADGYASEYERVASPAKGVEIRLTPAASLRGRVVRAGTDEGVSGVRVETIAWRGTNAMTFSGGGGEFEIGGLVPGRYGLEATVAGWYGRTSSTRLGLAETGQPVTVELHPVATIAGLLEWDDDHSPCTDGKVSLVRGEGSDGDGPLSVLTMVPDAAGAVSFEAVLPGTYQVSVECQRGEPLPAYEPIKVAGVENLERTWLVRRLSATLVGVVVDDNGKPVEGADVSAMSSTSSTTTDDRGRFVLDALDPDKEYEVVASQLQFDTDAREKAKPGNKDLRLVLGRGATLTGEVKNKAGDLLANVQVVLDTAPKTDQVEIDGRVIVTTTKVTSTVATTGLDSRFISHGLAPGRHEVFPLQTWWSDTGDEANDQARVSVELKPGETTEVSLVLVPPKGTLRGRVVDESGNPISDAFVQVDRMASSIYWFRGDEPMLTDTDGSFALSGLPAGPLIVIAYRRGGGEARAENVHPGDSPTLAIAQTATVSGTATRRDSPPEPWLYVEAKSENLERSDIFFRSSGAWRVDDLPPGQWEIIVRGGGSVAKQTLNLRQGQSITNLELVLEP